MDSVGSTLCSDRSDSDQGEWGWDYKQILWQWGCTGQSPSGTVCDDLIHVCRRSFKSTEILCFHYYQQIPWKGLMYFNFWSFYGIRWHLEKYWILWALFFKQVSCFFPLLHMWYPQMNHTGSVSQSSIKLFVFPFSSLHLSVLGCRGDWGGRGKHGVLPWRAGQCEHSQHQRLGRPQQPAEHGQRRGLLLLQCQTCLFLLEPCTTTTTSLPNPLAPPSIYPSGHACVHTPSHLRQQPRPQLNGVPVAPASQQHPVCLLLAFSFPLLSAPVLLNPRLEDLHSEVVHTSEPWATWPTPRTQMQWRETPSWFLILL